MTNETVKVKVENMDITSLIKELSNPSRKLNAQSIFSFILGDQDGSLYSSYINGTDGTLWKDAQFKTVTVQDYTTNKYYFIGRISNITFKHNTVMVECEGYAAKMDDKPVSSEIANFIYAEGKIKTVDYDGNADQIELCDTDDLETAFTWDVDQWVTTNGNAILINDSTDVVETVWDASAKTNGTDPYDWDSVVGDFDKTLENDNDEIVCSKSIAEGTTKNYTKTIEFTIDNDTFTDSNDPLTIEVEFDYNIEVTEPDPAVGVVFKNYCDLQIYNEDTASWVTIHETDLYIRQYGDITKKTAKGSVILSEDVLNYIHKTISDYDEINLRFSNYIEYTDAYAVSRTFTLRVDFLSVKIRYQSGTHSPMTALISGNGASYVDCNGYDFDASGVSVDDTFQIGENTTDILKIVFAFADIDIDIDPTFSKFIARNFKGMTPKEVLNAICLIEDAYWFEYYNSNGTCTIYVRKRNNFDYNPIETYYFTNDTIDAEPSGWTINYTPIGGVDCTVTIAETVGDQDMVIDVYEDASDDYITCYKTLETENVREIKFKMRSSDTAKNNTVRIRKSSGTSYIQVRFYEDKISWKGSGDYTEICNAVDNTWYSIHLIINWDALEVTIYVDDVEEDTDDIIAADDFQFFIISSTDAGASHFYIDDIEIYSFISNENYGWDFEVERRANFYSSVRVLGNALKGIDITVADETITSPLQWLVIDESINTQPDAYDVANNMLDRFGSIQASIVITLNQNVEDYLIGSYVYLSLSNPTIAGFYPVRKIDYNLDFPMGLSRITLFCGLGETPSEEHFTEIIKKSLEWAKRAHLNKQNVATMISSLSYNDLTNKPTILDTSDVEAIIDAELVDGQSIDNRIDSLIATAIGTVNELNEMVDVDMTGVAAGDLLEYSAVDGFWHMKSPAEVCGAKADANPLNHDKTIVNDSITDGNTTSAPSENAVFDALALKQNDIVPHARVRRTSNMNINNNTNTVVPWETEDYDNDTMVDIGTYPNRITAKTAGIYLVSAIVRWDNNTTGSRDVFFSKNANGAANNWAALVSTNNSASNCVSNLNAVLVLAANDYIELNLWQNSGGTRSTDVANPETYRQCNMTMTRLGDIS